jgi:hypothetical protein
LVHTPVATAAQKEEEEYGTRGEVWERVEGTFETAEYNQFAIQLARRLHD